MSNALLSVRIDNQTKQEIAEFATAMGLSVSAFVTVILKQAIKEGRVVLTPFYEPNPELQKLMRQAKVDHQAAQLPDCSL